MCCDFLCKFCLKNFSFKEELSEMILLYMCIGLHVKYTFLSYFSET